MQVFPRTIHIKPALFTSACSTMPDIIRTAPNQKMKSISI